MERVVDRNHPSVNRGKYEDRCQLERPAVRPISGHLELGKGTEEGPVEDLIDFANGETDCHTRDKRKV